ncbi:CYFA0S07e01508g1_1 [Cyberlindnera fabianii]|uniref:CYFA0S07e01508g1_1 n=1 Tax=Cyberlindnera fabianii TaxID=36022 RepID=A0A061AUX9_CYBFA|nr:CYFA0S07e01508g1_1 [Cyberlindnera fabianii]
MAWPYPTPQVLRHPYSQSDDIPPIIDILTPSRHEFPSIILTARSLHLFNHSAHVPISSHERSDESIEKYGSNVSVNTNIEHTMIVIQTDKDFLLVYALLHPELSKNSTDDELLTVYTTSGNLLQNGIIQERATGFFDSSSIEEPIPKFQLRFKLFLKITNGIVAYLPLSNMQIMLVTRQGAQVFNLGDDFHKSLEVPDASNIKTLYRLDTSVLMLREDGSVSRFIKTGGEDVYKADKELNITGVKQVTVNNHFNLLTFSTIDDKLIYYNYSTRKTIKEIELQGVKKIQWSQNGNFMLVLFTNQTWSLLSTFGCTMFSTAEQDYDSAWLNSVTGASILPDSAGILLSDSTKIFYQPLLHQVNLNSQINYNTQHPVLVSGSEIHIYTGHEMPITSSNRAIHWNIIKLPYDHAHQLPNIRHGSISSDGKYLALANRTALLIYSFADHDWSFYNNDFNHDLDLRHITWHPSHNLLIVTNRTHTHSELVVFDFRKFKSDENFNSDIIVFKYDVGADVKLLNITEGDMVMYTVNGKYYHFKVEYGVKNGLRIDLVKILAMDNIFKDSANLRAIIHVNGNLVVLSNGELVLLKQRDNTFEKLLLFERVEYVYKINDDEFYLFNGGNIILVKNFAELISSRDPSKSVLTLRPDSYPLLLTMEKGLFVTIENSLSKRRHIELNVITSKNSIFLHDLIRFEMNQLSSKDLYAKYKPYKNFQFALELLLYQTVVNDEDLKPVVKLLKLNSLYELNVVSKCLRKIETIYWEKLLTELGTTPQQLLKKGIELQQYKTLGILVIIFLSYQTSDNQDGSLKIDQEQLITVLKLLYENAHDDDELWETAFELLRFFKLLDGSGALLKKCETALAAA